MAYPKSEAGYALEVSPAGELSYRNLELAGDEEFGEGPLGQIAALASAGGLPTWVWAALGGAVVGAIGVWVLSES